MMRRTTYNLILAAGISAACLYGQFNSGSTGADGALSYTTPGTYDFDPAALGINAAGDNIFNFTTINIASGVTLRLRASKVRNAPVVWLASGNVTIAGTVDLSGGTGAAYNANREPAEPGAGGYPGGVGGSISSPATPGDGPGGGQLNNHGCGGSYGTISGCGTASYGNVLLIPLRGGSGGAGAGFSQQYPGSGGGAGGGAIQIVSSGTLTVSGSISANGGTGGTGAIWCGGGGSGGGIHLQAQTFGGNGSVTAGGGTSCTYYGGYGRIRIDATTNSFTGTISPTASFGTPFNTPLPTTAPSVRLLSVNSVAVPANPLGSYTAPDVTINANTAINIAIAGANIPLGTVVKLYLSSETGADQVISCVGLSGTVASSTATCSATFPLGTTATLARAIW